MQKLILKVSVLVIFWYGFFRTLTQSNTLNIGLTAVHTIVLGFFVPGNFGFTYVQTALMCSFVSVDLFMKGKDSSYDVWSWLVNLPVVLVGWLEAVTCTSFLIYYGGHLWYDAIIPISITGYAVWEISRKLDVKGKKVE